MSIEIKIFADNDSTLKRDLESLAPLTREAVENASLAGDPTLYLRQTLSALPLDVVRQIVNEIFDPQGFEVVIKVREEGAPESQESPPEPEPTEAPKTTRRRGGGRPPLVDAKTAAEKLKGNGADAPAEPEVDPLGPPDDEPESSPEADREYVLDGLGKIIADPKRKAQAMTFAARMAKENGTDKLTKLGPEKFPLIRVEMEKEFPSG